ncbi:chromosome partitioning protein ParB [Kluyvera sichuanensis]|uniref:chromosome partitioning protein ParB n=1 Tax=Kluyvera sichuanensis TaxID=2725494 RepID=UPI00294579DD|nr:chromosome partitioning protein ParB [Kluyvera ascorbata]HED3199966.1 chromosome partitioning protein ParB [Kluyvera ascorbata]HED4087242.1 chromosome partitioning protein ParB [Kluyvera ascorbata]
MAANSFKLMTRSGVIKRTDTGMFISLDDIHVRDGFNKREDDERTRQADDDLFNYLMNGGSVPPLEVIARDEGGVWVVEGHRRRRCYARCRDAGKPVDRIHIMPFNGNDVQRLARIMTSNNQLPLSAIEQAAVIQELHNAFNQSTSEIAKLVNKSVPTVEKLLALSMANHDVQQVVKAGEVSVEVAVERVKEHGERAGEVLEQDKAKAAAAGKKKVTKSFIAPEISVKKARRAIELLALAQISDEGIITLEGIALAEVLDIIDEQKRITADRSKAAA